MSIPATPSTDVLILGGGLAGGLLARHLRRALPEASVTLLERRTRTDWKVGESTVEIAGDYLVRRLGLGAMLYQEHLPKNGLRFFFDQPGRDAPLRDQSEIGTSSFAVNPSFQVDRARLEARLLDLALAEGVSVRRGAKIEEIHPGDGGAAARHTVRYRSEDGGGTLSARWVVDASGRSRLLARQLGLARAVPGHAMVASWGRVRGLGEIDQQGDDAWRARVRHTSRMLSTNHLMYPGYWIWLIPLREGITSVGVVGQPASQGGPLEPARLRGRAGLLGFLREHRSVGALLEGAELLDHGVMIGLAHRSERYLSPQRWSLVGESGCFADPFYSPGSDFIARANDLTVEAIRRDLAGEALADFAALGSDYIQHQMSITLGLYQDQYSNLGSYDLFRLRYLYDLYNYFNQLTPYARDAHLDPGWLKGQLAEAPRAEAALLEAGRLFGQLGEKLRREGSYFRGNRGGMDGHFDREIQDATGRSLDAVARTQRRLHHGVTRCLRRWLADELPEPPAEGWMRALWEGFAAN